MFTPQPALKWFSNQVSMSMHENILHMQGAPKGAPDNDAQARPF